MALADTQIPLAHGQVTMTPKVEARLLQALKIKPEDEILEVGTGSAYMTALLAESGHHVLSMDIYSGFIDQASIPPSRFTISLKPSEMRYSAATVLLIPW